MEAAVEVVLEVAVEVGLVELEMGLVEVVVAAAAPGIH